MNKIIIFFGILFVSLFTWHDKNASLTCLDTIDLPDTLKSIFNISPYCYYKEIITSDYWWTHWSTILIFCLIFVSHYIYKKTHWTIGLAFFWYFLNGIYYYIWRDNPFQQNQLNKLFILNSSYYGFQGMFCLSIMTIFFLNIKDEFVLYLEECFAFLCIADSVYVIIQFLIGNDFLHRGGMLGNGSMNGCLIALTYCYLNFKGRGFVDNTFSTFLKTGFLILPIIAIFLSMTSIPVGVLFVVIMTYFIINNKFKIKKTILHLIPVSLVIIGIFIIPNFLDSNGRFDAYKLFFHHWWIDTDLFIKMIGTGSSISPSYLPPIQIYNNFRATGNDWFIWIHNDWLQLLIENGFIGITIYLFAALHLLLRSYTLKHSYVVCILLGYYACMLFNYPLHIALTAFLGCLIIRGIYVKRINKTT